MMIALESAVLCAAFTLMVYAMSREPIKMLFDYPPNIQERVKTLDEYRDMIPTGKDKAVTKIAASLLFTVILALILRYVNGYRTFGEAFGFGLLLWTVVNLYDVLVLDIIWFCHDPHFVLKGTEDMVKDYHDYLFHIKGFFTGEAIALAVCFMAGLVVKFIFK